MEALTTFTSEYSHGRAGHSRCGSAVHAVATGRAALAERS
jgi:hypothetical protein